MHACDADVGGDQALSNDVSHTPNTIDCRPSQGEVLQPVSVNLDGTLNVSLVDRCGGDVICLCSLRCAVFHI